MDTDDNGNTTSADMAPEEGAVFDRLYDARARSICFAASSAEVVAGLVLLVTFWAAYGWTMIHGVTALTMGWVGSLHYVNRRALVYNSCCCHPVQLVNNQAYIQVALSVFSGVAVVLSFVAAALAPDAVFLVAAIINAVACIALCICGCLITMFNNRLIGYTTAVLKALIEGELPFYHQGSGNTLVVVQPQVVTAQPVFEDATAASTPRLTAEQQNAAYSTQPSTAFPGYVEAPQPQPWQYNNAAQSNPYVSAYPSALRPPPPPDPTSQQSPLTAPPTVAEEELHAA